MPSPEVPSGKRRISTREANFVAVRKQTSRATVLKAVVRLRMAAGVRGAACAIDARGERARVQADDHGSAIERPTTVAISAITANCGHAGDLTRMEVGGWTKSRRVPASCLKVDNAVLPTILLEGR